jgi:hypothetical protein
MITVNAFFWKNIYCVCFKPERSSPSWISVVRWYWAVYWYRIQNLKHVVCFLCLHACAWNSQLYWKVSFPIQWYILLRKTRKIYYSKEGNFYILNVSLSVVHLFVLSTKLLVLWALCHWRHRAVRCFILVLFTLHCTPVIFFPCKVCRKCLYFVRNYVLYRVAGLICNRWWCWCTAGMKGLCVPPPSYVVTLCVAVVSCCSA